MGAPVDRLVAAVATLEQLRAMGVYRPEAAAGLADALRAGYDEDDLSRVAEDYRRHAAVGGEPEAFFRQLGSGPPGGAGVAGTGLGEGTSGSVGEGRLPNERGGAAEGLVPGVEGMGERDEDSPYRGGPRDPADAFRPDGPHEPGPPDTPRP